MITGEPLVWFFNRKVWFECEYVFSKSATKARDRQNMKVFFKSGHSIYGDAK